MYNTKYPLLLNQHNGDDAPQDAIPTPTIDPSRAINTKSYIIPEIHKEEVKRQIEQMLKDDIIQVHGILQF